MTDTRWDVVVLGGGAAGLSAALVLARVRRRVLVIDSRAPRNTAASHVHGFLTRDGMPPGDLLAIGRAEVSSYGGQIDLGTVRSVAHADDGLALRLLDGTVHHTRRLLVATGLTDELPAIPGLAERWGRDVLHCPYCHGWEVRDQPIGVIGTGPQSVHQALLMRQLSDEVTFFRHTFELDDVDLKRLAAREIRVVDGPVHRLVHVDDRLTGVRLVDRTWWACSAVFVSPRVVANHAVLDSLGVQTCDSPVGTWILTDPLGRTNIPTVWAAGNVTDPTANVIGAAAAGSKVAMAVNADMVEDGINHVLGHDSSQVGTAVAR